MCLPSSHMAEVRRISQIERGMGSKRASLDRWTSVGQSRHPSDTRLMQALTIFELDNDHVNGATEGSGID